MATRIIGIDTCLDYETIIGTYKGSVLENQDGTVSVFVQYVPGTNVPLNLSKACCEYISSSYYFDIENQKCRWSTPAVCNLQDAFKLTLNPKGNDGTLFYIEPNDNCHLTVDFDYLFKVKCETLSDIINTPVQTIIDPVITSQINTLEEELVKAYNVCGNITNQIIEITTMIDKFSYSIVCDFLPMNPVFSEPIKVRTIGNSAFGNIAPFGVGETLVTGQLYCINEPEGLAQWRAILGETNYSNFIVGDQTSYTCTDVQTIFNLNATILNDNIFNGTNTPQLIEPCTTPLNTKSDLVNQLSSLVQQQTICTNNINTLTNQITELQNTLSANTSGCATPLDFFETFDVSMSIDVVTSANTLQTVYSGSILTAIGSGNLYSYLQTNPNSGFYVCGDPTGNETQANCTPLIIDFSGTTDNVYICDNVRDNLVDGLFTEFGGTLTDFQNNLPANAFASQWLHYNTTITDPNIISLITNQKIKLSININHTCGDFCVLVDEISLNKVCNHVESNSIFLTQSPGFELDRIRDNKKSWVANTTPTNRPFVITNNNGSNNIRQTNYDVNDERLIINSKEIDLDISLASAIENDIWCYISDNPCLLTGITTCLPCVEECGSKNFQDDECFAFMDGYSYDFMDGVTSGSSSLFNHSSCCGDNMIDFASLMTQPLSAVTTIEDFEYFLTSELIDAKNRQTISGYPTLRALYDRYMNSGLYCGNSSSKFDYMTMDQFANLVGNYWVDIVEQVVPATTIWGSTKIYSNTIFDQQKFKYKSYSSLLCNNIYSGQSVPSPINGKLGQCVSVEVETTTLAPISNPNARLRTPNTTICDSICIAQMNSGSEFIGKVTVIGDLGFSGPNIPFEANVINEI